MKKKLLKIFLLLVSFSFIGFTTYHLFYPIFISKSIIFTFAITPFDIIKCYPKLWDFIKKIYFVLMFISYSIIFIYIYNTFQKYIELSKIKKQAKPLQVEELNQKDLKVLIGKDENGTDIFIKESGLFQNILITGTIGTRQNFFSYVSFHRTIN